MHYWIDYLVFECRIVIGIVLIVAGAGKLAALDAAARTIESHFESLLHWTPPRTLVASFSLLELALGFDLVLGLGVRFAGGAGAFLFVGFCVASLRAGMLGLRGNCGCYGLTVITDSWPTSMVRNLVLLAGALITAYAPHVSVFSVDAVASHTGTVGNWVDLIPALPMAGAFAAGLLLVDSVLRGVRGIRHQLTAVPR
jgi:uncharacterized membrane protein YphA (DoxX/SURF4 family)